MEEKTISCKSCRKYSNGQCLRYEQNHTSCVPSYKCYSRADKPLNLKQIKNVMRKAT